MVDMTERERGYNNNTLKFYTIDGDQTAYNGFSVSVSFKFNYHPVSPTPMVSLSHQHIIRLQPPHQHQGQMVSLMITYPLYSLFRMLISESIAAWLPFWGGVKDG